MSESASATFSGSFRGVFVGNPDGGFGFAAGFRWLEDVSIFQPVFGGGPAHLLDGALLFTQSEATTVPGLSSDELNSLTRVANLSFGNGTLLSGVASNLVVGGGVFVEGILPASLPLIGTEDFEFLRFAAQNPISLHSNVGGFDVQWGLWQDATGENLKLQEFRFGLDNLITRLVTDFFVTVSAGITDISSLTGTKQFDSVSNFLIAATGFADNSITSVTGSFSVDFGTGTVSDGIAIICLGTGTCDSSRYGVSFWPIFFGGTISDNEVKSRFNSSGFTPSGENAAVLVDSIGHFVGSSADGFVLSFTSRRGIDGNSNSALENTLANPDRIVSGAILFGGTTTTLLSLPAPSIESYSVDWGAWDNPISENWVVVSQVDETLVRLSTDEYFANVIPTPIANLQGSASYGTTVASSFIGSGNAGALTDLVAGMDIDFDTGVISNGKLMVEVGGSQVWSLQFNGSVVGGAVDLNMISGQLSNFGDVLSNRIDANLGGVFTGNNAEAFVGGFNLVDQINSINQVNGIYTIER